MLYKVTENKISETEKISFLQEKIKERNIENWIEKKPGILGEELKIIGRQVVIEGIGERLDLLALDKEGNLVVIELKTDIMKSSAVLQAVQYASYISGWQHKKIEKQMKNYFSSEIDFIEEIEDFCEEEYEINDRQRIILGGRKVKPRSSSVAIWLRKQGTDIKIVQLEPWKDEKEIYLYPKILIPLPAEEELQISNLVEDKSRPWKEDGKDWHLNNRCTKKSAELLNSIIDVVEENWSDVQGPNWNQKLYVSFKINGSNWIYVRTQGSNLRVQVRCFLNDFETEEIAERLRIKPLGTDVNFQRGENENCVKKWTNKSRMVFRLRADFVLDEEFTEILNELKESFESKII